MRLGRGRLEEEIWLTWVLVRVQAAAVIGQRESQVMAVVEKDGRKVRKGEDRRKRGPYILDGLTIK